VIDSEGPGPRQSEVEMDRRDVWLLFTKKLTPEQAEGRAKISGDRDLARPFFRSRAIMG
jgi:hypothetical protein